MTRSTVAVVWAVLAALVILFPRFTVTDEQETKYDVGYGFVLTGPFKDPPEKMVLRPSPPAVDMNRLGLFELGLAGLAAAAMRLARRR